MPDVEGGYVLYPRIKFDSDLWKDVHKCRLFDLLIGKAQHSEIPRKFSLKNGEVLMVKRGQYLRSYRKLAEDLEYVYNNQIKRYSLSQLKRMIDELIADGRITKQETELGTLYTVIKYHIYQDPNAYRGKSMERSLEHRKNNNNNVNNGTRKITATMQYLDKEEHERIDIEKDIIGAILYSPTRFFSVKRSLTEELFKNPLCKKIISALHSIIAKQIDIDPVNIYAEGKLDDDEIFALCEIQPNNADLSILAHLLTEKTITEKGKELALRIADATDCFEIMDMLRTYENEASSLIHRHLRKNKTDLLNEYAEYVLKNQRDGVQRIPTGYKYLDAMANGGLDLGGFSIIGGQAGSGKTSFMLGIALHAARNSFQTTFIEGEMTSAQIFERLNGIDTGEDIAEIRKGKRYDELTKPFLNEIHSLPFNLVIATERTLGNLVNEIQHAIHTGSKLVFVDYLQVFASKGGSKDEFQEIKFVSETLRQLSLKNGVHIFVASTLNRKEYQNGKASLASLYGSSGLGYDASLAIILPDEEDSLDELQTKKREVEVNIVKNRDGARGNFNMIFELASQRFT